MATQKYVTPLDQGGFKLSLGTSTSGSVSHVLGNSNNERIGKWMLQVVLGGGTPGSFIPKLRVTGSGLSGANLIAPVYYKASVSTAITAGDPVTTADIYEVITDGCDLVLVYTTGVDGMTVYAKPLVG